MMQFHVPNLRTAYPSICQWVLENGDPVAPRGQATREIVGAQIRVDDPTDVLPVGVGRKLNPALATVEALQLIGECSFPDLMVRVAPNTRQFLNGGTFHAAYGQRTRGQVAKVIQRLTDDRDCRQAVMTVWDPQHDLFIDGQRDYPCTILFQFLIRQNKLQLHVTMRSNDVWWGLAYDAFMFTQLQLAVANAIGIEPGLYVHNATSLHAYERDSDGIRSMAAGSGAYDKPMPWVFGFGHEVGVVQSPIEWCEIQQDAANLLAGTYAPIEKFPAEHWMAEQLEPYRKAEQETML